MGPAAFELDKGSSDPFLLGPRGGVVDAHTLPPAVVLANDDSFVAVDKPPGLLSVPGRGALAEGSLLARLQAHDHADALVVHRLDMATSGVMLFARGAPSQRALSLQFAQRSVAKTYVAVVSGCVHQDSGEIDLPLSADWPARPRQKVDRLAGKPSLTRYAVLHREPAGRATRLRLEPLTGRSHQLRVHLLAIGHPILGDTLYADSPELALAQAPRLLLHAQTLAFSHPLTGASVNVTSAPPF